MLSFYRTYLLIIANHSIHDVSLSEIYKRDKTDTNNFLLGDEAATDYFSVERATSNDITEPTHVNISIQ